jgi:hypothetical protein
MSIISSNDARLFIQATDPWAATIPNSSGTASVATADGLEFMNGGLNLRARSNRVESNVASGSLGRKADRRGRRVCDGDISVPLRGSGTAGTVSDMDQIVKAIFGAAGTVVSSTSVTYNLAENMIGLTAFVFRDPSGSNIWNEILAGGLVNTFEISGGGEEAESVLKVGLVGVDVIAKPEFSGLTTAEKRGLSAWPSEPSAPTFLGQGALGFTGSATINSVSTFQISRFSISGDLGRRLRYPHGSRYATVPIQSKATFRVNFSVYEEDTSAQATLRGLARSLSPFAVSIVIGEDAGNIHTFNFGNVTVDGGERDESGDENILNFSGVASVTTSTRNEFEYVAT